MRRLLIVVAALYVVAALGTRLRDAAGSATCHCSEDCWCRRPLLSTVRWVAPVAHR